MDGPGVSTGDLARVLSELAVMTYPPQVASVRAARRFVQATLASTSTPAGGSGADLTLLADDAGLMVSELATNAVLHARTDFDVVVHEVDDGVRVSVHDRSRTLPVLLAPSATAMSGRGLALVQTMASRWGAGPSPVGGKSVWFEVALTAHRSPAGHHGPGHVAGAADVGVQELLAAWSEPDDDAPGHPGAPAFPGSTAAARGADEPGRGEHASPEPASGVVDVVLPELPAAQLLAAKEAMDDVLRELQLVLLAPPAPAPQETSWTRSAPGSGSDRQRRLDAAARLDQAARAFDDVRRQVRHQVNRAVASGQDQVVLRLRLASGASARAAAYQDAVEAAETLAQDGEGLLSVSSTLLRHHAVRRAYLEEVIAAPSR